MTRSSIPTTDPSPAVSQGGSPSALPLHRISISKSNPRKHLDEKLLEELTASVRTKGVLQPVLVRPVPVGVGTQNGAYELVCGQRRLRAAQAAGLEEIPVVVRELSDVEVLEVQVIENLQRADVHPLEEAEGYRALMSKKHGYTAERIGERIGRPARYVYDRVALLGLSPAARKLFLDGTIAVGHAIPLARLSKKDQERAMQIGALLSPEQLLWNPNNDGEAEDGPEEPVKAVTVREFQAWIDKNVRFEKAPDPVLFPETVATLGAATEKAEKIVPITHDHYIAPETRDGHTYGPRSWKRADGKHGSKACNHSVVGVVVVGPERGEAFRVCVAKEKCTTHWGKEQKEKARRAKNGGGNEQQRWEREEAKRAAAREQEEVERKRWVKARPAILEAVSEAVAKAPVGPGSLIEKTLVEGVMNRTDSVAMKKLFPRGTTAEELVRHLAFAVLHRDATFYGAYQHFPKQAKAFNVDVEKILNAAAPVEAPKASPPNSGSGEKAKNVRKRKKAKASK